MSAVSCDSYIRGVIETQVKTIVRCSFAAIPKTESVFKLQIKDIEFKIYGKYLNIRPAERAVKKIKNFMEPDL